MKQMTIKLTSDQRNFLYFVKDKKNYPDNTWKQTILLALRSETLNIPLQRNLQILREEYLHYKANNPESPTYSNTFCRDKNGELFCYSHDGQKFTITPELYDELSISAEVGYQKWAKESRKK